MGEGPYILSIDQGTTSTRSILFDRNSVPVASFSQVLPQIYPEPGWVEHDPNEIWRAVLSVTKKALEAAGSYQVAGIGITNQRETTVLWNRQTGEPVYNAIVWQDRRTAPLCEALRERGLGETILEKTGLIIDPYFSATKICWMLEQYPDLRHLSVAGDLCFGTIDSWLIYKLTGGTVHATDSTNASRTMLFNINSGAWDDDLLSTLSIPKMILPEVKDCQAEFGVTSEGLFDRRMAICGVAGDQQAALFGQACFEPGMIKATYGTGCFVLVNTGPEKVKSRNRMVATIAYQLEGVKTYALEGSIFMAGATIQWLRDNLGLVRDAGETEELARCADEKSGVVLVPAFQGLGAPYWDAEARGAIIGLSRASSRAEIVRAGLESVAFQTRDLIEAVADDMNSAGLEKPNRLRVDGGMTANNWLMQFLADLLNLRVEVAAFAETTALGAAFLAGRQAGLFQSEAELAEKWQASTSFEPQMSESERQARYTTWQESVARVTVA